MKLGRNGFRVLVELGGQSFAGLFAQDSLQESAGVLALRAVEATCFQADIAHWGNDKFDCFHAALPTAMVSLIEPSARDCSVTVCPWRRASSVAFSVA